MALFGATALPPPGTYQPSNFMIKIPLGQGELEYSRYLAYMIWLTERNLVDTWHYYPECKANVLEFDDEQDALAFRLRFGL